MMDDFTGGVAVITGGASGIGFGLASKLVDEGMRIVIADIETAALEKAAEGLRAKGADVLAVQCDVSDRNHNAGNNTGGFIACKKLIV